MHLFETWKGRNTQVLYRYEPENDANGNPTVPLQQYLDRASQVGLKVIVQLDVQQVIPWANPALFGTTQPDEPDNYLVSLMGDNSPPNLTPAQAAAVEAQMQVYESMYRTAKLNAPNKPVFVSFDAWQYTWKKVDYPRLANAADAYGWNYYFDARNLSTADWLDKAQAMQQISPGRAAFQWISGSYQNLDKKYYPNERVPTVQSVQWQINQMQSANLAWPIFPDSFPPPNFVYDATPPAIADLIATLQATTPTPPPTRAYTGSLRYIDGVLQDPTT